jgi:GMP synthase (glutamine-hydrolysing)
MHIHFIIHEHFEAPGAYETWGKHHGHTLTCSRVYKEESLPEKLDDIDMLIVMGRRHGPLLPNA